MIHAKTISVPDQKTVESLQAQLKGELILPGTPGYDEGRSIWNRMIDRYPGFIVKCRTKGDVAKAIRFAGEHRLPLSIKGGGHNVAGNAVCDGGLVIDLSPMKSIHVDVERKT